MVPGLQRLRDRYEAVLLDLDGTLLDGRSAVTDRTKRAVRALVDHGFLVILCTGRGVAGTEPIHAELGLTTPVVTYNGSWIGDPGGTPEQYITIPHEHLEELFEHELDAAFAFRHHRDEKHTVMTDHPDHGDVARWFEKVVLAGDRRALPTSELLRLSMFFCESELPTGEVEATLNARLPATTRRELRTECFPLNLFPPYADSTLHLFEVQGWSDGKAEAYRWLLDKHGIPAERTIAVGDHRNDVSMLAGAGLALTPANAVPEAKARAHLVIGHHAEDGVAAWVEAGGPTDAARPRGEEPAA